MRCTRTIRPAWGSRELEEEPRVVKEGDIVTLHFSVKTQDGEVVEDTRGGEPITFEVGAGDITGNKFFQAFDEAVRGLSKGQSAILEASGGEWRRELLFTVPYDHEEVQRLAGRYKNQGGLSQGQLVELSNKTMAMVVDVTPEYVKLDANNIMAGKVLEIMLDVLDVTPNVD